MLFTLDFCLEDLGPILRGRLRSTTSSNVKIAKYMKQVDVAEEIVAIKFLCRTNLKGFVT